jgi:hypothetical protein
MKKSKAALHATLWWGYGETCPLTFRSPPPPKKKTPHIHTEGRTDEDLMRYLTAAHLTYIPTREGGWDTVKEWKDVFSGGEKQRVRLTPSLCPN